MKTLQEFWRWFDNEKPDAEQALEKGQENLSTLAMDVISDAADYLLERRNHDIEYPENVEWALAIFPEQTRDLSLAICAALLKMHESVPKVEPEPESAVVGPNRKPWYVIDECQALADWLPMVAPDSIFMGTRASGKSDRIAKMAEMFETGKITTWHQAQVVNGVLMVVDKTKETP